MSLVELDGAVAEREERPIAAGAHALAGMVLGTALADDDAAGEDLLAAKNFDAEALGRAVAAVAGGFLTCFMCHGSGSLGFDGLDLDDGKLLAMAAFALHALALLLLENNHFISFYMFQDFT